ncbi:MAG: sugar transferase [Opitutaceae bacterium]|nr:sugar transferase [Opitutaceae bacterium]
MSNPAQFSADNVVSIRRASVLPWWKRAIDVIGSLAALPILVPMVFVMLVVTRMRAPGPVFFRQERVGLDGRRFTIFKFRTMKAGASVATHQAHAIDFIKNNRPMTKMDSKGDSRLIPFGRILRATGLDELPQVFNVLLGDMSLVGPRPCIPYEYEAYETWQKERFRAMPGLTGLWQVSGKNKLSFEQMIRLDIRYANNLSFWEDLRIIFMTVPTLVGQVMESRRARLSASQPSPVPGSEPVTAQAGIDGGLPSGLSEQRNNVLVRDARRKLYQFRFPSDSGVDADLRVKERA